MQTTNTVKTHATKLHDILGAMGCVLTQSQCLDVVSDIDKPLDSKTRPAPSNDNRIIAEQYLDTIVEAFMEQNYEKATRFYEEKFLVTGTEKGFRRDVLNSHEDLGAYVRREFLGSLKAESRPEDVDTFPDHVRFVWRGIFEKNETLLIIGLYKKNGVYYTSDIDCKY